jgi:hypothetical protein
MKKIISLLFSVLALLPLFLNAIEFNHTPTGPIKIGERYLVSTKMEPMQKVSEARLYFKSDLSLNFSFMSLDLTSNKFFTNLPAPGQSMKYIDYFFVIKPRSPSRTNKQLEVVKSSVYRLYVSEEWQDDTKKKYQASIKVMSELNEDKGGPIGFVDDVKTLYQAAQLISKAGKLLNFATLSNYPVIAGSSAIAGSSTAVAGTSVSASSTAAVSSTAAAGMGIGTIGAVSAVGVAAAVAVSGSSSDDGSTTEKELNYDGAYTVNIEGVLSGNLSGDCFAGASLTFSNVELSVSGSSIILDFGTGTMSGTFSNGTASIDVGNIAIEPGTPGFNSTDNIQWSSFTVTWSGESSFTSNSFTLDTFEIGVNECSYQSTLNGSK